MALEPARVEIQPQQALTVSLQQYIEKLLDERDRRTTQMISENDRRTVMLVDERDRQYEQRFKASELAVQVGLVAQKTATDAALTAQKTATDAAFAASEKAIVKSDVAYEKRFEGVNEFRKTLDDAQRVLMPRNEAVALIANQNSSISTMDKSISALQLAQTGFVTLSQHADVQAQITSLRETRSSTQGKEQNQTAGQTQSNWLTGLLVGAGLTLGGLLIGASNLIINLSR